jgi:lipopolysaccharide biosynthesis glycosyltransferase
VEENIFHCAFAIDNNYCQHFAAALVSLIESNSDHNIYCHVVSLRVNPENKNILMRLASKWPKLQLRFYDFDDKNYSHYRVDEHISLASYMRLFLASLLPTDVRRLVYIDSDTIVTGSIKELFDMPLEGAIIAAAPDLWPEDDKRDRLKLGSQQIYFNAGVLVIDLENWRLENYEAKILDYVEINHATLRYHDQDALNACLGDRVKYLDMKWNFQSWHTPKHLALLGYSKTQYRTLKYRDRVIIHFMSPHKPWLASSNVPLEHEYLRYVRKTPWRATAQPDRTWKSLIKRDLIRIKSSIGSIIHKIRK